MCHVIMTVTESLFSVTESPRVIPSRQNAYIEHGCDDILDFKVNNLLLFSFFSMAKTAAERQRARRARIRENNQLYEAYKANERRRKSDFESA